MFFWICYVARCDDEHVFLSMSLRAVCNRARSCSYAERIANCVFSTTGEGRDYEHNWAGHHLPQPGWDHRDALYVTTSNALIHWNLRGYKIFWLPFKSYINSHNKLDIAKIHSFFRCFLWEPEKTARGRWLHCQNHKQATSQQGKWLSVC